MTAAVVAAGEDTVAVVAAGGDTDAGVAAGDDTVAVAEGAAGTAVVVAVAVEVVTATDEADAVVAVVELVLVMVAEGVFGEYGGIDFSFLAASVTPAIPVEGPECSFCWPTADNEPSCTTSAAVTCPSWAAEGPPLAAKPKLKACATRF